MLRAALKSLLARKLRLLLTGFSVVLGVGFVAGTYVLTDTMNAAFDEVFDQVAVGADVIVRSESAFDPIPAGPGGGAAPGRIASTVGEPSRRVSSRSSFGSGTPGGRTAGSIHGAASFC